MNSKIIINELLLNFTEIRYVAIYYKEHLTTQQKHAIVNNSSSNTDEFEELLVNPALLTLARQRGNIDCGGLRFLIVGYGNFYQLISEIPNGHISICLEQGSIPTVSAEKIYKYLNAHFGEFKW